MDSTPLTTNLLIQYIIVGAILLAVAAWIVWKLVSIKRHGGPKSCCGCSLSQSCGKAQRKSSPEKDCCSGNNH